ncbi:UDP-N-acetylmuramoyl-L-alanine--D-glutamate ligase [Proteiniclasticum sp. SCR006]|uniref:UDP-N-acetylmuramoylalanine--D-glutamate ligase n=1 Tax=Proteiniclasticum aestuarii TaxID=2817862 RepID=A0A939H8M7_9CLOT|nr:UDP-N-acetylmuramoyl-L-alanine--D-glutamate ligase [Proteiniclasticum aestuarii]MBO1266357.1 UDP-N-acetylmuramoyl-L-alanine--D-glutamate ligase [Proteiniclasticum aestuarii]
MSKDFNEFKQEVKGKRVGVVGLGVSNIPLMEFLLSLGAEVVGYDKRNLDALSGEVHDFKDRVRLHLGEDYLDHLTGLHMIFKTPGMRFDHPALVKAMEEGARITSEMEEFLKYCRAKTIGITGSDGKTTTTTVVGEILRKAGYKVFVGGNIGTPLFTQVESIRAQDMVVLELSSFQLMTMTTSPEIAIVTNLSPNHLDVHKDMEEYIEAKKNIFRYQKASDLLILNEDNEITKSFAPLAKGKVEFFSSKNENEDAYFKDGSLYLRDERIVDLSEMKVKGIHNAENFLAAFLAVEDFVVKPIMRETALTFPGVKHRCQFIREHKGVKYYNDSIASSPTRTLASLRSFDRKVNVILGGYDKQLDFAPLAEEGYKYIRNAVLVGATKYKIQEAFRKAENKTGKYVPLHMAESFEDAVKILKSLSKEGDAAILSPACASFDLFRNFEERGDRFVKLVNEF